jgi:uridine kinase
MVGITGGSGSGKTSLARALVEALGPRRATLLCHDAYYRDRSSVPLHDRAALDYDVPEALDQGLFLDHLQRLRSGQPVRPPAYCFATHCRIGHAAPLTPPAVILVDGILLLWDPAIRAAFDLTIYVDAPEDVRLTRRVARDVAERGRSADAALAQFRASVRPAHAAYVEPTRAMADLVLGNVAPLARVVEIATALILDRLTRRPRRQVA